MADQPQAENKPGDHQRADKTVEYTDTLRSADFWIEKELDYLRFAATTLTYLFIVLFIVSGSE